MRTTCGPALSAWPASSLPARGTQRVRHTTALAPVVLHEQREPARPLLKRLVSPRVRTPGTHLEGTHLVHARTFPGTWGQPRRPENPVTVGFSCPLVPPLTAPRLAWQRRGHRFEPGILHGRKPCKGQAVGPNPAPAGFVPGPGPARRRKPVPAEHQRVCPSWPRAKDLRDPRWPRARSRTGSDGRAAIVAASEPRLGQSDVAAPAVLGCAARRGIGGQRPGATCSSASRVLYSARA